MSILFSNFPKGLTGACYNQAIYASIVGSNIGAYLTPIGALAGIMWMSILKKQGVDMTFLKFTEYGLIVAIPTLLATLCMLMLIL